MLFNKIQDVPLFTKLQGVTVTLGEDEANFTVDVGYIEVLGTKLIEVGETMEADPEAAAVKLAEAAIKFIHEWDLEEAPGTPIPLTVEAISQLPVMNMLNWITHIVQAAAPANLENRASKRSKKPTSQVKKQTR